MWAQTAEKFRDMALDSKNNQAIALAEAIEAIPASLRDFVLKEYLRRIALVNGIFFYAKRRVDSAQYCDDVECKMQIANLQRHLAKGMDRERKGMIHADTLAKCKIADEILHEFGLLDTPERRKAYSKSRVNELKEVGWLDPFPVDEEALEKLRNKLARKSTLPRKTVANASFRQAPKKKTNDEKALQYV